MAFHMLPDFSTRADLTTSRILAGDTIYPRVEHLQVAVQTHEICAVSGGDPPMGVTETDDRGGVDGRHAR